MRQTQIIKHDIDQELWKILSGSVKLQGPGADCVEALSSGKEPFKDSVLEQAWCQDSHFFPLRLDSGKEPTCEHGPGMMGWGMMGWIAPIMMFVFWAVVIVALIFLVRWIAASTAARAKAEDLALEILKRRYARGEINKEEFETKKRDLT